MDTMETHPFEPFLPDGTRLLICGTFPPAANRWSMEFYYPNFINDMWRIFGLIYFDDRDALVDAGKKSFRLDEIKRLLTDHYIGMSDTGREIVREKGNASDKYLDIRKSIDLRAMLEKIPDCVALATTGEKAASVIAESTSTHLPKMGENVECEVEMADGSMRKFIHWRMPSSSRAYPMKLEKKAEYYRTMLSETGLI